MSLVPRRAHLVATVLLAVSGLAGACDSAPVNPDNIGWVTTLVDSTPPALQEARTFAVPDTIAALNGGTFNHAQDKAIAAEVRAQFLSLGWIEKKDTAGVKPDVVIVMGTNTRVEVGISYADWFPAYGWIPYWGTPADPSWVWGAPAGAIAYVYEVSYCFGSVGNAIDLTCSTTQLWMLCSSVVDFSTLTFDACPDGSMLISSVTFACVPFLASPASTASARQREMIICLRASSRLISSIFSGGTMFAE